MSLTDIDSLTKLEGGTDGTQIGNEGDALKVSSTLGEQQLKLMTETNMTLANILRMLKKIENQLNLMTEFDIEQNFDEE